MLNRIKNIKHKKLFVTLALLVGVIGVASTVAFLTATAGTITNTFSAAKVTSEIEEQVDVTKSVIKKNPYVVNTGPSNAYIRARITVTPSDAGVVLSKNNRQKVYTDGKFFESEGWIYGDDGWYYCPYVTTVEAGEWHQTPTLFDKMTLESEADVTVYQESVYSALDAGAKPGIEVIKNAFDQVDKEK